jgi:hypothetical protein
MIIAPHNPTFGAVDEHRADCSSANSFERLSEDRARAVSSDQRRALRVLAGSAHGCTQAIMLARGFEHALLDDLVLRGLVAAEQRAMCAGRWPIKVTWLMITEAGQRAQWV